MLYLYAIADSGRVPELEGLRGAPARAIGEGDLFAIVSEHVDLRLEANEEDLWAHEALVEALMDGGAVLPVRFGTTLRDDDAVRSALRERAGELARTLERVCGAVELGVRAAVFEPDTREPVEAAVGEHAGGAGTAYMLGLLDRERRAQHVATAIHDPLRALARASTSRVRPGEPQHLNAAYLVERDRVAEFQARVAELDEELADGTIVCTGPWPPYSFSSGGME